MDADILSVLKLGGIHIARSGLRGEYQELWNYEDSIFPVEYLVGKVSADLLVNDTDARRFTDMRLQVARGGVPIVDFIGTPLFKKPGFSHARIAVVPRYSDESHTKIVGTTSMLVDISDKCRELETMNKQLQETVSILKKTNEELQTAVRAKQDFLAMMSHEIRTPLNGIIGMLQLLDQDQMSSSQIDCMDTLFRSGHTLLRIINSILDFSKLEHGPIVLESKAFSLKRLLSDAVTLVKAQQSKESNTSFFVEIDPTVPDVLVGDDTRIFQVICNLLHNAVKYTDNGSITARAHSDGATSSALCHLAVKREVNACEKLITIRFEIEDTGLGISKDLMRHLFEPFSQVHPDRARLYGGTGLGLAICRKLVEAMGGKIGVESAEGKGSTFWFKIALSLPREMPDVFESRKYYSEDFSMQPTPEKKPQPKESLSLPSTFQGTSTTAAPKQNAISMVRYVLPPPSSQPQQLKSPPPPPPPSSSPPLFQSQTTAQSFLPFVCFSSPVSQSIVVNIPAATSISISSTPQVIQTPASQLSTSQAPSTISSSPIISSASDLQSVPIPSELTSCKPAKPCVLVAEDNAVNLKVLLRLLERLGVGADSAVDGKEAYDMFVAGPEKYKAILMDCMMPVLDGVQSTEHIRKYEKEHKLPRAPIPIIATTAHVVTGVDQYYKDRGMNDYLAKPIMLPALENMLKKWHVL